jgi:hypothetical protein
VGGDEVVHDIHRTEGHDRDLDALHRHGILDELAHVNASAFGQLANVG